MSCEAIERRPPIVIASKARATQLAERIATKHDMALPIMLCAKRDSFARAARAELAHELADQLKWSQRRIAAFLGLQSHAKIRDLIQAHALNQKRGKRWLPKTNLESILNIEADEMKLRLLEAEERAADLEAEVKRLTGTPLALHFAEELNLQVRAAIVLAILTEAYPRTVIGRDLFALYCEAADEIGYGRRTREGMDEQDPKDIDLMDQNMTALRVGMRAHGLTNVFAPLAPCYAQIRGSKRLSDEAAKLLTHRFSKPSFAQMEAAQEAAKETVIQGRER